MCCGPRTDARARTAAASPMLQRAHARLAAQPVARGARGASWSRGARPTRRPRSVTAARPRLRARGARRLRAARRRRHRLADAGRRRRPAADPDQLPRRPRAAISGLSRSAARGSGAACGHARALLAGRRRQLRARPRRSSPASRSPSPATSRWPRAGSRCATSSRSPCPTPSPLTPQRRRTDARPTAQQRFRSRPDLRPPIVRVQRPLEPRGAGRHLPGALRDRRPGRPDDPRTRRASSSGSTRSRAPTVATNLRVQSYGGAPVLTWWQGTITNHGFGLGVDEIVGLPLPDARRRPGPGNGLQSDLHEFQITPAGTALITAYYPIRCNLAAIGGAADSAVTDSLFQEIDIKTGLVHVPVDLARPRRAARLLLAARAAARRRGPTTSSTSTRSTSTPTGRCSSRAATPGPRTTSTPRPGRSAGRSAASTRRSPRGRARRPPSSTTRRPLGADAYLAVRQRRLAPGSTLQSRGRRARRSTRRPTAVSRPTQFLHPGRPLLADSQGNLQALPDGHWLVGWGQEPDVSEFSAAGALLFDASLPTGYESYRALRFPWTGTPRDRCPRWRSRRPAAAARDAYVELERRHRRSRAGSCSRARPPHALDHIGSVGRERLRDRDPAAARRPRDRYARGPCARQRRRACSRARRRSRCASAVAQSSRRGECCSPRATNAAVARRSVNSRRAPSAPATTTQRPPSRTSTIVTGSRSPPKCQTSRRRPRPAGRAVGLTEATAERGAAMTRRHRATG